MKSRSKDHLSDADAVYKEELDKLVEELEASRLDDTVAQPLLLQLVEHATKDAGNITTVPKALQFLIEHKGKLCDVYTSYVRTLGDDSYSVFLILELMSFLDAIATPADASKEGQPEKDELAQFKLMLYKIEAGMVAERLIADARTTEEVRSKLVNRKINDWGNEFLTSFSTQIVRFFNMQATRDVYDSMARSPYQMDVAAEVKASVLQRFDTVVVISEALKFTEAITDYFFQHGFEFEAIDLLLEVDLIESIRGKCGNDYDLITRVTSYLISISAYAATHAETRRMLVVAYEILLEAERFAEALRLALKLDEPERLKEVIFSCGNANVRKQLAFSCAAHGTHLSYTEEDLAPGCKLGAEDLEELNMLSSGEHFSGLFLTLAVELDVVDPKMPKDIFKAYPFTKLSTNFSLNDGRTSKGVALDSALGNLSHTFVNAFLNCGFGTDLLINVSESDWVYHHNDYGLLCAVASVGIISLWNVEEGLSRVDKYEYSSNSYVKAGVYAAYGLSSCGVLSEADPLAGLLQYKLDSDDKLESLGAVLGLGFGYAGTQRESLLEYLVPLVVYDESEYPTAYSAMAAVALGLIFVGSGRQEASEAIIQRLLDMPESALDTQAKVQFACALGMLQIGRMEAADVVVEALGAVEGTHGRLAEVMVDACAYAGSGDVIRIQRYLKCCAFSGSFLKQGEVKPGAEDAMEVDAQPKPKKAPGGVPPPGKSKSPWPMPKCVHKGKRFSKVAFKVEEEAQECRKCLVNESSIAILGIALTALGDPVGCAMLPRLLEHPLQFGSLCERRAAPLALALAYASNPTPQVVDILSKLTHDVDYYVMLHATFGLGLVGAGTNNARIALLLQNLAKSHTRDTTVIFVIRIAAGLLHMGKGTTTISPLHSEGFLLKKVSLAGLLLVVTAALDIKSTFAGAMPYTLLFTALAIRPRWLITLTPDIEHVPIPCRVGNMVETTGTVGKQRRISGFQTHQTPVLVGSGERAELASEEYEACTTVLEGIVIVEKNDAVTMD